MDQPSVNVLAHSGQDQAEKLTLPASGASLEQVEVVLLALDGVFGAGTGILVALPESTFPGDEGVQPIVPIPVL